MFLLSTLTGFSGLPSVHAAGTASAVQYRDIYLTHERVCKKCSWALLLNDEHKPSGKVLLRKETGEESLVDFDDVIGIDTHPYARRLFLKSLHGLGFRAQVIVPQAFPDIEDFMFHNYSDPGEDLDQ